jgi:ketosteroid isomerase-like protein
METKDTVTNDSSKSILMRHLASFQDHDLEALMSDYTNDSVLITQAETYKGVGEIGRFFEDLIKDFPKQRSTFSLDKFIVHNELAYIVWHAKTPSLDIALGSDTFIIKDGKIFQQTYVNSLKF